MYSRCDLSTGIYYTNIRYDTIRYIHCSLSCVLYNAGWCVWLQEVIRVVRDFKCCAGKGRCCACCRCCQMEVSVEAPVGEVIGYVRQEYVEFFTLYQGRNHGWKVEGTKVWVPTPCAPRPVKYRAGCWCGRGSPPPAVRLRRYDPRKVFENSDAKSCILVTTCCEISCFLKTTAKKLGHQYIVGPPTKMLGGPVSPRPYGCCAYALYVLIIIKCLQVERSNVMR